MNPTIYSTHLQKLGQQIGLTQRAAERVLIRLIVEGYIRTVRMDDGIPYLALELGEFLKAEVLDLTDKGMRMIDLLPVEDPVEGVVKALEAYLQQVEQEQAPAEDKERKRTAIQKAIGGICALVVEVGPKLAAELLWKGTGMGT